MRGNAADATFALAKLVVLKQRRKKFKVKVEELLWELFLLWFIRLLRVQKLEVTYFHQQSELFHVPNREPLGNPSFKWNIGFCALVTSSSGHFLKKEWKTSISSLNKLKKGSFTQFFYLSNEEGKMYPKI